MADEPRDPPLYEPFPVQEVLIDGFFSDARIVGNTFRCTAFSMQSIPGDGNGSHPVAVVRLVMTPRTIRHFTEIAAQILREGQAAERVSRRNRRRL